MDQVVQQIKGYRTISNFNGELRKLVYDTMEILAGVLLLILIHIRWVWIIIVIKLPSDYASRSASADSIVNYSAQ